MSEAHPESGTTTYTHDDLGRLVSKAYDGQQPTVFGYDLRDRLLTIDYPSEPNNPDVRFCYGDYDDQCDPAGYPTPAYQNPWGNLKAMMDATGWTTWSYDLAERPIRKERYFPGIPEPRGRGVRLRRARGFVLDHISKRPSR